jgi:hyperosmotically inducible periplasmic protein
MVVTEQADTVLEQAVSRIIHEDPILADKKILIQVSSRVVILEGVVDSLAETSRAQRLAATVEGVRDVENCINLNTAGRSDPDRDKAILHEAKQALACQPFLQETQIKVDEGKATLSGAVDTLKQKMKAQQIVSEIRGVTAILNLIEVTAAENPTGDNPDDIV